MWFWALHGLMKQVDHQRLHAGDIGSYSVQGDHWPAKRVLLRVMLQRRSLQQLGSSPSSAQLSAGAPEPRSHTSHHIHSRDASHLEGLHQHGFAAQVVEEGPDQAASTGHQDQEGQLLEPFGAGQLRYALEGEHSIAPPGMKAQDLEQPQGHKEYSHTGALGHVQAGSVIS